MNIRRLLLVSALPLTLLIWGPAPSASALSCVGPSAVLADASQVFTGQVIDGRPGQIEVQVDEVWRGGPVPERVWLDVDLEGWSPWAGPNGTIPDGFSSSTGWVFAPGEGSAVSPCSAWELDGYAQDELLEHRPDHPAEPSPEVQQVDHSDLVAASGSGEAGGTVAWQPMTAGAALLALIASVGLWVRRRKG